MLLEFIRRFLGTYSFTSIHDFMLSLHPSFKYGLQVPLISISGVVAVLSRILGFGPAIVVAMVVAVLVETYTGIKASRIQGIKFESFKFSRCLLKVFIWYTLIYITNSFALECASKDTVLNDIGATFFEIVRLLILAYFVLEYVVSIMENLAVIDGKPKTQFVDALTSMWSKLTIVFKRRLEKKGCPSKNEEREYEEEEVEEVPELEYNPKEEGEEERNNED